MSPILRSPDPPPKEQTQAWLSVAGSQLKDDPHGNDPPRGEMKKQTQGLIPVLDRGALSLYPHFAPCLATRTSLPEKTNPRRGRPQQRIVIDKTNTQKNPRFPRPARFAMHRRPHGRTPARLAMPVQCGPIAVVQMAYQSRYLPIRLSSCQARVGHDSVGRSPPSKLLSRGRGRAAAIQSVRRGAMPPRWERQMGDRRRWTVAQASR